MDFIRYLYVYICMGCILFLNYAYRFYFLYFRNQKLKWLEISLLVIIISQIGQRYYYINHIYLKNDSTHQFGSINITKLLNLQGIQTFNSRGHHLDSYLSECQCRVLAVIAYTVKVTRDYWNKYSIYSW